MWWLIDHLAVLNLIDSTIWTRLKPLDPSHSVGDAEYSFDLPIHTLEEHLRGTTLESSANRSHLRNAMRMFGPRIQTLQEAGIAVGVLVIPSKERVAVAWARRRGHIVPPMVLQVVESETELTESFQRFFADRGVTLVDATEALVAIVDEAAVDGIPVYPRGDGHPLRNGYLAYARAAEVLVKK